MKRLISCAASDFMAAKSREELTESIRASEGRVIMAQTAVGNECLISGVTNAELIGAFGTDMILLKVLDVEHPAICGIQVEDVVQELKRLTGRLVGINLEVIGENHLSYAGGTVLSEVTRDKAIQLKPDFLCLTAYRNKPGITTQAVLEAIQFVRKAYDGMLIVNRYMNAKEALTETGYESYIKAGADVLTLPMPGSVAGLYVDNLAPLVLRIKDAGGLVSLSVSTSQEGTDTDTMKRMAFEAKQAGADLYDFGDANQNGIPAVENIMALSVAVRGKRHTYFRIAQSIRR